MRSRALRICLVADLAMFFLLVSSYRLSEFWDQRGETWPWAVFCALFLCLASWLITTLIVALFWRDEPGAAGTGFSKEP